MVHAPRRPLLSVFVFFGALITSSLIFESLVAATPGGGGKDSGKVEVDKTESKKKGELYVKGSYVRPKGYAVPTSGTVVTVTANPVNFLGQPDNTRKPVALTLLNNVATGNVIEASATGIPPGRYRVTITMNFVNPNNAKDTKTLKSAPSGTVIVK